MRIAVSAVCGNTLGHAGLAPSLTCQNSSKVCALTLCCTQQRPSTQSTADLQQGNGPMPNSISGLVRKFTFPLKQHRSPVPNWSRQPSCRHANTMIRPCAWVFNDSAMQCGYSQFQAITMPILPANPGRADRLDDATRWFRWGIIARGQSSR